MQNRIAFALLLMIAALMLASCPAGTVAGEPGNGNQPPGDVNAQKQAMIDRHNSTRSGLGLSSLTANATLNSIAQAHAEYMASSGNLTHVDASGGRVDDRADAAGYNWTRLGENIGYSASAEGCYQLWLGSTDHYANITNGNFVEIGVGVSYVGGVQYWCVVFGSR